MKLLTAAREYKVSALACAPITSGYPNLTYRTAHDVNDSMIMLNNGIITNIRSSTPCLHAEPLQIINNDNITARAHAN